jgi:bifunctional UDP-N-acetylglucosamine pyrophosphorylase / glucosamine-1-phosphate N-acetyltransferase
MSTDRVTPDRRLAAVVLAAGESKRFKSRTPKILHPLAGRPILAYVLRTLAELGSARTVVVVPPDAEAIKAAAKQQTKAKLIYATQARKLGTADAARTGMEALNAFKGEVLVLPGDTPLLTRETLETLVTHHRATRAAVTILSARFDDPTGYGRIVRGIDGGVSRIVEHVDANDAERAITECNTSVYVFDRTALDAALTKVERHNVQGELYLTDVIEILRDKGEQIEASISPEETEAVGVNSRVQLAEVQSLLRRRINQRHMIDGVTIEDPTTTYIDDTVTIGADTVIRPNTHLHGTTTIGEGADIGPNVVLKDTTVQDEATVLNAVAREAKIGKRASVGPYTSLRPGSVLEEGAKAGTYVEIKKSIVGKGSKVPHLSYIGDAEIGRNVNVGAGTITCNYDGETGKKSKTVIGDDVLIGSDTMLVAPVTLGKGAVTGAGSVVTKDVPPGVVVVGAPAKTVRKRKPKKQGGHKK